MKQTLLMGIAGSIASMRAPDFIKQIRAAEPTLAVKCILTSGGAQFTTQTAIETFSGTKVLSDNPFGNDHLGTDHIALAREASVCLVYGATADFIAKYRAGICDSFLLLQLIATRAPVLLAPAMNPQMWQHPSVQENISILKKRGVRIIEPVSGVVACGESGVGHIAEPHTILKAVQSALIQPISNKDQTLIGKKILISAGPMQTAMDPVRFLQNRSSGKMGLALALKARSRGAEVHILLGPVHETITKQFHDFSVTPYVSATDYELALKKLFPLCDWFLSAAAVLDFEIEAASKKIERKDLPGGELQIRYKAVPDFAAWAGAHKKPHQRVIAFAAETGTDESILERAKQKMIHKKADCMIANPVREGLGPDADQNLVWFISPNQKTETYGPSLKTEIADWLLNHLSHCC